jgi:hypothetical protein
VATVESPQIDPKQLLIAAIAIERDLSIMTGAEIQGKYSSGDNQVVFEHNPFWHYLLQTWYKRPVYRKLLYIPRHRDEVADAVVKMATGELDTYDGVCHQYPRRALKSFFMKMMCDWLPKRHKIIDDMDISILYSHNLEKRAKNALESVKNMNRHSAYIRKHFGEDCKTVTGKPANFALPLSEWGAKEEWDWPCRDKEWMSDQKNLTAEAALSRKAGAGFNYKLLDDWESEESRKSQTIRDDLEDRYDQLRQLNAPTFTREWVGGTPYNIQSLYKAMIEGKHEDGTPRYYVIKKGSLTDTNEENFPTIPRLTVPALAKERANEIRRRGTDRFWYLQYQLDPTLTGEQALQWEFFQPLTPEEFRTRFGNLPKFRAVYCDPAWKGDDNHQQGSDAAIGTIDSYSIAGQIDNVLLDLCVSNDMESDEGADEILRQLHKWHTHFYSIEQQADKGMVGMIKRIWKTTPRDARPINIPRCIDPKGWSKKSKNDRISSVAGQAKMGHWYYLTSIPKPALDVLKVTVNEYPASVKRDTLDMMANANSEEILSRWVPIAVPVVDEDEQRREPDAPIWGVTTQNSDLRVTAGYSSGGTFTALNNPLRGTLFWDRCMFVLQNVAVAGGATGGSYTVTIETDAVAGYTGLPIARAADIGPNSATTIVMDNLHQSPSSPLPTHMFIDQTATGGGITLNCQAVAKQYRGTLGTQGGRTAERVLEGDMIRGNSSGFEVGDDAGISVDVTFDLTGNSGSQLGMHRMRLWDNAMYWAVAGVSIAGTHDIDVVTSVGGATVSIATTGTGGALNVAGEKLALASNFYGQSPNPTAIIWTEVTAGGVSDARVVGIAKGGRGSMGKR